MERARGAAVRNEFWDLVRSGGMQGLVGEDHDCVGDSVEMREASGGLWAVSWVIVVHH